MKTQNDLPLNLYKTNLELGMRTHELLQKNRRKWLDLGVRYFGDGITEARAELDQLSQTGDWQGLSALPADAFWRQAQQRFGDAQALMQIAIANQTALLSGMREAMQRWQQDSASALGMDSHAMPVSATMSELMQQWLVRAGVAETEAEDKTTEHRGRNPPKTNNKGADAR